MAIERKSLAMMMALVLATLGLEGCATQQVAVLHASAYCVGDKAKATRWLTGSDELAALWRANSNRLPSEPLPVVDFQRQAVLFLAEPERPTGGYTLELANPDMSVSGTVAKLAVRTGAPDGMATQALSRPCLYLGMPEGPYDTVEVVDQGGNVWGVAQRPGGRRPD